MACRRHGPECKGHATEAKHERPVLEYAELGRLLAHCKTLEERAVMLLVYDLALRAGEVNKIRAADVDLAAMSVRPPRVKGGKTEALGIAETTAAAIKPFVDATNGLIFPLWDERRVRDTYRRIARDTNLDVAKRYSHILRRSRATHLHEAGAEIRDVQRRLGHKSVKTTVLYLGLTQERKRVVDDTAAQIIERIVR